MRKISLLIVSVISVILVSSLGAGALAQNAQFELPGAGITPESPFYFLDRFGEFLQEFFTFNPEGKATLQITFAAERIAEIKIVLETKGVEARGLDVAQSRLQAHLARAATIVSEQKAKGRDVSGLAQELDDGFEGPRSALANTFKEHKRALGAQEEELKAQLRAAHRAGDTAQEETIAVQLGQVKGQLELLELREQDLEEELEAEEERIEEEIAVQHKAQEAIRKAEEELAEQQKEKEEEPEQRKESQPEAKQLSPIVQQLQGVWKLERILRSSGVQVDKEQEIRYEEYLSFRENKLCGAGTRDGCYRDYFSFIMEGEKIVTSKLIGFLGVEIEKVYFRNNKVEYHGFSEKGDIIKHFYGKISTEPLE